MTAQVPAIRLEVRLEGVPRLHVVADSCRDELRLRDWLRTSPVLAQIGAVLESLPDTLDETDEAGWTTAILAPLEHVQSRGSRDWLATCPICRRHALAVHDRGGGRVLVTCFHGCAVDTIRAALERAAA